MPKQTVSYRGKVNIDLKLGNAIIKKSTHNAGLPDMAYLFSKALTGNLNFTEDIPRYIDIGYIVPGTESTVNTGDSGIWMSILTNPVSIGGKQYKYDSTLTNWVGELTTTVLARDINGVILDNVLENVSNGTYQLQIRLCSFKTSGRRYFAYVDVDEQFITNLRDCTSAIITWYCELLYDENDSSTSVSGNVVTL